MFGVFTHGDHTMSTQLLSRQAVRNVDRIAVDDYHMPSIVLMENAGRNTAELLRKQSVNGPVVICCGKGNNGGDGFVIARHLENAGCDVRVLLFADPDDLKGDAATNFRILQAAKTPVNAFGKDVDLDKLKVELSQADWIVDALLGTGMTGEIREPYAGVIDAINAAGKKVLAVDVPSGLDCDTGEPLGTSVRASVTATFVARKLGFDNADSQQWTGEVHVIDIGVPKKLLENVSADS